MSDLRITDVDVHDESRLYDWWRVGRAATAEREFAFWPVWEVSRVAVPAENPERLTLLLLAERDGEPVGSGLMVLPRLQDREVAFTELYVTPEARRAGVGTALERRIEEIAREHGRTRVVTEAYTLPRESSQALRFLLDRGYSDAHLEEVKVLRMAEFADRVDALEAKHGPLADGYRLVFWDVEVPEEHIESFCEVLSTFMSRSRSASCSWRTASGRRSGCAATSSGSWPRAARPSPPPPSPRTARSPGSPRSARTAPTRARRTSASPSSPRSTAGRASACR